MGNNYIDKKYGLHIGAAWRNARKENAFTIYKPATRQCSAECSDLSSVDTGARG